MTAAAAPASQTPSESNLVYVHATAIESGGRFVTGISKDQFRIFEDNVPQNIASFSANDIPMTVGILLDVEASAREQARKMALDSMTRNSLSSNEVFIDDAGGSPLNDAVYQSLNKLLKGRNESRALVLMTTRNDPAAKSFSKVREFLRNHDVRLYVIGIPARPDLASDQARSLLRELAKVSGGDAFFPTSAIQVQDIYLKIGRELRNQYRIGYRSTNAATDGKWRKIRINAEVTDKNKSVKLSVRTRTGYYAPAQK